MISTMTETDAENLDEKDMDALRRCLKLAMQESPGRAKQSRSMLQDEPWHEVATFAAYVVQSETLNLDPWKRRRAVAGMTRRPTGF